MDDLNFDGLIAALIFLATSSIAVLAMVINLIIAGVQAQRGSVPFIQQKAFGRFCGNLTFLLLNLLCMWAFAANSPEADVWFDIFCLPLVIIAAILAFIVRQKYIRRYTQPALIQKEREDILDQHFNA